MPLRESLLENLAGDLEYHPRRGALYLCLAAGAFCYFHLIPTETKFTAVPLVFLFGAVALFVKGVFLFRKSSEGIGLTETDLSQLSNRKDLPSLPNLVAQIVQDFGAGSLLLWPIVRVGTGGGVTWKAATELQILLTGVIIFGLGWVVRRATREPDPKD